MACAECFRGFERVDTKPKGNETTLYGLPTYVSQPPEGSNAKGIIVIITDIFGWEFVNNRLLADVYAAAGYRVYMPDLLAGRAAKIWVLECMEKLLTPAKSWSETVAKSPALVWAVIGGLSTMWLNWPSASFPRVKSFFEKLRADQASGSSSSGSSSLGPGSSSALKIGAAGFCWGGKHTITLTEKEYAHLIDAAFVAHPSFLSLPGDIEKVRKPLSIAIGSKDNMVSVKQAEEAEKTLIKLGDQYPDQLKAKSEVKIYEGAGHGFSVRIDRANEKQVEQAQEAEAQALKWFDRFLA